MEFKYDRFNLVGSLWALFLSTHLGCNTSPLLKWIQMIAMQNPPWPFWDGWRKFRWTNCHVVVMRRNSIYFLVYGIN